MNTAITSLLRRPKPLLRHPNPLLLLRSLSTDITTLSLLLTNPPSPALETALDKGKVQFTPTLLQEVIDRFKSEPKLVYSVFLWAEKQQIEAGVEVVNGVVKVFARAKEFQSALCFVFDRIKRGGYGLDSDTFAILIRRYARSGLLSQATKCLELAYILNIIQSPNCGLNLFEILIDSFCKEWHVLEAIEYFKTSRKQNPNSIPSTNVYNSLLSGAFRSRKLELINHLLNEMKNDRIKHNIATYGTLVEGFCRISQADVAIELVGQMKDEGIRPNTSIYNPLIITLAKMGRFKEALGMLEICTVLDSGPSFSTYDSLVKSFCKASDIEGANKILKMMISRSIVPTSTSYSYFYRYFSNLDKVEEVMSLYTKMIESGYYPDRVSCLDLFKMLCKLEKLDLALRIRNEMKVNGYDLDIASYTLLVHLLCDTYRFKEAFEELKEMIDTGFVPRYTTCRRLFDGMKKHGSVDKVRDIYDMVASIPELASLNNRYGRDDYDSRVRKRAIMGKAKAISENLKITRDVKKCVEKHRSWKKKC